MAAVDAVDSQHWQFVGLLVGLDTHIVVVRGSQQDRCAYPEHPVPSGRHDYEE